MLSKEEIKLLDNILFTCDLKKDEEIKLFTKIRKLVERIKLVEQIQELDKTIDELDKPVEKIGFSIV